MKTNFRCKFARLGNTIVGGACAVVLTASVADAGDRRPPSNGGGSCIPSNVVPDQIIVELFGATTIESVLTAIAPDFPGVQLLLSLPSANAYLLNAPDPICEHDLILALQAIPGVEEAEFNEGGESSVGQTQSFFFAGLSDDFTQQYSWPLLGLDAAHTVTTGQGTLVAIIDSGLDTTHPLFADANILPGVDFVLDGRGMSDIGDGIDNDGDGAIDEMAGHGTFLAGIIHTVAPGATILPLRAMNSDGVGTEFAVAAALVEAMAQGADVINVSFVSQQSGEIVKMLIDEATGNGTVVVGAAGNGGTKGNPPFPAQMPKVCAVASTGPTDVVPSWSNVGTFVDLCAPGIGVVSSLPASSYAFANGTSVSTAFVSGAALLVRAHTPTFNTSEVISTLRNTATPIDSLNPGCAGLLGGGRLNLAAAVGAAAGPADLNADGLVNAIDLGILIGAWGTANADLTGDGTTDPADLGVLIGAWTN